MDLKTARYLIRCFPNLLSQNEGKALRHLTMEEKTNGRPNRLAHFHKQGWLSTDPEVLELVKDGGKVFHLKTAERILNDHPEDVYLNVCKKCGALTTTPRSRQCNRCFHSWHHTLEGQFVLKDNLSISNGRLLLVGEIVKGKACVGNFVDLTALGIACHPRIKTIEFAFKKENGIATEDTCLEINKLSLKQMELLENTTSWGLRLDILLEV